LKGASTSWNNRRDSDTCAKKWPEKFLEERMTFHRSQRSLPALLLAGYFGAGWNDCGGGPGAITTTVNFGPAPANQTHTLLAQFEPTDACTLVSVDFPTSAQGVGTFNAIGLPIQMIKTPAFQSVPISFTASADTSGASISAAATFNFVDAANNPAKATIKMEVNPSDGSGTEAVSPSTTQLGAAVLGAAATQTVTLTDLYQSTAELTSVAFSNVTPSTLGSSAFAYNGNLPAKFVSPFVITGSLSATPDVLGSLGATVTFNYDNGESISFPISASGVGVNGPRDGVTLTQDATGGPVYSGAAVITNSSELDVTVSTAVIANGPPVPPAPAAPPLAWTQPTLPSPATITSGGGTLSIPIAFTPGNLPSGDYAATLTANLLNPSAVDAGTLTVSITATVP
jgi:hypothetical protein